MLQSVSKIPELETIWKLVLHDPARLDPNFKGIYIYHLSLVYPTDSMMYEYYPSYGVSIQYRMLMFCVVLTDDCIFVMRYQKSYDEFVYLMQTSILMNIFCDG